MKAALTQGRGGLICGAIGLATLFLSPPVEAAANKIYVFNGQITKVDSSAHRFTLSGDGKAYVFHVTSATKITWRDKSFKFSDLKKGLMVAVDMQRDSSGQGIATAVRLAWPWVVKFPGPNQGLSETMAEKVLAAPTPEGKRLSAGQLKPLILYSTWPREVHRIIGYQKIKPGVFLLSVGSDGSVNKVETLQPIGHRGADADAIASLRKWKFRPGSVKEVRVPVQFGFNPPSLR